jgi:hypothetical protein
MCAALDTLKEYEQYSTRIVPLLRRAMSERWSSQRIRKEVATFSQALMIQQALGGNVSRASQIATKQDVLDRYEGRPHRR